MIEHIRQDDIDDLFHILPRAKILEQHDIDDLDKIAISLDFKLSAALDDVLAFNEISSGIIDRTTISKLCKDSLNHLIPHHDIPHHATPLNTVVRGVPKYYCCDSRRVSCPYSAVFGQLNYCVYDEVREE